MPANESSLSTTSVDSVQVLSPPVVLMMVISSFTGVGVIGTSMLHVAKQLYCGNESRMSRIGKHSNMAVFVSFLVVCVAYSVLKTDLVMPVGPKGFVSCDFGYLICWWSYYISKVCLWCCFMVRIDMTFHMSALAYKRLFLAALTVLYMLLQFAAMALVLYFGIFQVGTEFVAVPSLHLGVCTTKVFATEHFPVYLYGATLYALLEIVFQLLVCFLFVSKLRKLTKMGHETEEYNQGAQLSRSSSQHKRDERLRRVMNKQTVLVMICVLSTLIYLIGAFKEQSTFLTPIDCIVNAFCVWFMFRFADALWNYLVSICCICGRRKWASSFIQRASSVSILPTRTSKSPTMSGLPGLDRPPSARTDSQEHSAVVMFTRNKTISSAWERNHDANRQSNLKIRTGPANHPLPLNPQSSYSSPLQQQQQQQQQSEHVHSQSQEQAQQRHRHEHEHEHEHGQPTNRQSQEFQLLGPSAKPRQTESNVSEYTLDKDSYEAQPAARDPVPPLTPNDPFNRNPDVELARITEEHFALNDDTLAPLSPLQHSNHSAVFHTHQLLHGLVPSHSQNKNSETKYSEDIFVNERGIIDPKPQNA